MNYDFISKMCYCKNSQGLKRRPHKSRENQKVELHRGQLWKNHGIECEKTAIAPATQQIKAHTKTQWALLLAVLQ